MAKVEITGPGIKKALSGYNYLQAFAEFIWNGFDAKGSTVDILFKANEIGYITELGIKDNGYGIQYDKLITKFVPFSFVEKKLFDSEKWQMTDISVGQCPNVMYFRRFYAYFMHIFGM